jgi:hypothetical protein
LLLGGGQLLLHLQQLSLQVLKLIEEVLQQQ